MSDSPFTEKSAPADTADDAAVAARKRLQPVLAQLHPAGGFLIKHCVGDPAKNSKVDVPLTYADYYFLEALLRHRNHTSNGNTLPTTRRRPTTTTKTEPGSLNGFTR